MESMTHQLLGWCSSSQDPTYSFAWSRETPPILPCHSALRPMSMLCTTFGTGNWPVH